MFKPGLPALRRMTTAKLATCENVLSICAQRLLEGGYNYLSSSNSLTMFRTAADQHVLIQVQQFIDKFDKPEDQFEDEFLDWYLRYAVRAMRAGTGASSTSRSANLAEMELGSAWDRLSHDFGIDLG